MPKKKTKCSIRYEKAKAGKVGDTIECAYCGTSFVKRQWQQAFCCPECKQKYWDRKGDRHKDPCYYSEYDARHPERIKRAKENGYYDNAVLCIVGDHLTPAQEDEIFWQEAERRQRIKDGMI